LVLVPVLVLMPVLLMIHDHWCRVSGSSGWSLVTEQESLRSWAMGLKEQDWQRKAKRNKAKRHTATQAVMTAHQCEPVCLVEGQSQVGLRQATGYAAAGRMPATAAATEAGP
jgi:hypothetical protein